MEQKHDDENVRLFIKYKEVKKIKELTTNISNIDLEDNMIELEKMITMILIRSGMGCLYYN